MIPKDMCFRSPEPCFLKTRIITTPNVTPIDSRAFFYSFIRGQWSYSKHQHLLVQASSVLGPIG